MPRPKPTSPTRRQRQRALSALDTVIRDESAPAYAKAHAARALLNVETNDETVEAQAAAEKRAADAARLPRQIIVLPSNGREPPHHAPKFCSVEAAKRSGAVGVLVVDSPGKAEDRAEHAARIARMRRRNSEEIARLLSLSGDAAP